MKKMGLLLGILLAANAALSSLATPAGAQTTCGAPECGCMGSPGQADQCVYAAVGNGCSGCNQE
jgi:hypothetical protein